MKAARTFGFAFGWALSSLFTGDGVSKGEMVFLAAYLLAAAIYFLVEELSTKGNKAQEVPTNRAERRHPNGQAPAQKFKTVNAKGRQKQGRGKAVRGW